MINLKPLSMTEVLRIYAVANIPSYLYERLRAEPTVKSFSDANQADALIKVITTIDRKRDRTAKAVALAYASLIALTFRDFQDMQLLLPYKAKNLAWFAKLLQIYEREREASTTISLIVPPTMNLVAPQSTANTTRLIVNVSDERQ